MPLFLKDGATNPFYLTLLKIIFKNTNIQNKKQAGHRPKENSGDKAGQTYKTRNRQDIDHMRIQMLKQDIKGHILPKN